LGEWIDGQAERKKVKLIRRMDRQMK